MIVFEVLKKIKGLVFFLKKYLLIKGFLDEGF